MTATRTPPAAMNPGAGIDYELFLDCIHCGLCLTSCPTYEVLGTEQNSPRGRIYLMRAVTDGRAPADAQVRHALDMCLDCRACESACPSGVQYHNIIEPFRIALDRAMPSAKPLPWFQRFVLQNLFPYAWRDRLALAPARWMQWSGLDTLARRIGVLSLLPKSLRQMHDMLPPLKSHHGTLPEVLPAEGPRRARVAFFTGCVADAVYPETNRATVRVLQKNGCEVLVPRGQGCCGALAYHMADETTARGFGAANCSAFGFGPTDLGDVDAIVTNAAGCGAMLKDYAHLLHGGESAEAGAKFAAKVRDVSEFLTALGPVKPTHPLPMKATYHDACHLAHGQKIRTPPRQLLEMIPELTLVPLPESELCCGAAGSYNLTQPEMAEQLGSRKAAKIIATGASAVLAGNVGCLMQISRHLRAQRPDIWIAHPIDALWASYSGNRPGG
ncbi:MAG: heterodisulfide reductase-related iron-sulfur binding cluster [Gemmataceae bacterium]